MPIHHVTFNIPDRELGVSDICFRVEADGELFGTLLVSKGAVEWRPAKKKSRLRMTWERLDEIASEKGTPIR